MAVRLVRSARRRLAAGVAVTAALLTWLWWQPQHSITLTQTVGVEPRRAWEHVADFNNVAALSPLITEFELGAESGSYADWRYTVTYREKMATLPLVGTADSSYRVRPVGQHFEIEGRHRFCYMILLCSRATSVMEFAPASRHDAAAPSTWLTETITYDCPLGLGDVCARETTLGRRKFLRDLQRALEA